MIDVGGAALLGAAARNAAGVAAVADPAHYAARHRRAARAWATVSPETAGAAGGRGLRHGRRLPRRDRRLPQPDRRQPLPATPRARPREGATTCATARTRTSAPRSTARRPTAAARSPTRPSSRATCPSFNNLLDLDAAYRIARDYTAPTVAIVKHTDPVGLASHDELVEAYRHALETDPVASFGGIVGVNRELDGATAREIAAQLLRGGRRARLTARPRSAILRAKARPRAPGRAARPDRGHARLRHRQPRLQAHRRRPAGRDPRRARRSTAASSRS